MNVVKKTCIKCERFLDTFCFQKKADTKDGLKPYCKNCSSSYNKEYYLANKEAKKAYNRVYYKKNKTEKV